MDRENTMRVRYEARERESERRDGEVMRNIGREGERKTRRENV
jgi:hypothetical protein